MPIRADPVNSANGAERSTSDPMVLEVMLDATRAMLHLSSPADARAIATQVVESLGGTLADADAVHADPLPIDLSFGEGRPVVPVAAPDSSARLLLERHLPALVEDLRRAVELASTASRLAEDALTDALTGLPNRRMLGRVLGRVEPGQAMIIIDLDHFKRLNDEFGHAEGDEVLRAFGEVLRRTARGSDVVGRFGGEEFAAILATEADARGFLDRLRQEWERARPRPVTFSAGAALVVDGTTEALRAADRAMYDAKARGRDQWRWDGEPWDRIERRAYRPRRQEVGAFVAFSELEVGEGGTSELEQAFQNRLGEVESSPGFRGLEVWSDLGDTTHYTMVSWWDSREEFLAYMRSASHRKSHERVPTGPGAPRARRFRRYRVIAT